MAETDNLPLTAPSNDPSLTPPPAPAASMDNSVLNGNSGIQVPTPSPSVDTQSAPISGSLVDNTPAAAAPPMANGGNPLPGKQPGLWQTVLQGALWGLAASGGQKHFGGGLGAGAKGVLVDKPQQEADIKFKTVQAADMLVQARIRQKQLDNLPQEQQDAHNEANLTILDHLKTLVPGLQFDVTENTPAGITSAMKSETATSGGVPTAIHLNIGDKIYSIRLDQLSGPPGLALVNDMLTKQGQAATYNSATWQALSPEARTKLIDQSVHFQNPLPSEENLSTYKNYLATATANKDQKSVDFLTPIVNQLQTQTDANVARVNKQNADKEALAQQEKDKVHQPVVDKEHAFQAQLTRETAELNRKGSDANARNLKVSEMVTKEANDRDTDLNSIAGVQKQIGMAQGGNQQAYQDAVTRFAEHEIKAGGMSRFNTVEQKALGPDVGSWARQLETYASKGFTGKGAAPTLAEMQAVLALETKQRNDLFNSHVGNIQENILGQKPAKAADPASAFGGVTR